MFCNLIFGPRPMVLKWVLYNEILCCNQKRQTRGASKSASRQSLLPVVPMFSWSDGPDRFSVTTEDYSCLDQDNLLNDRYFHKVDSSFTPLYL